MFSCYSNKKVEIKYSTKPDESMMSYKVEDTVECLDFITGVIESLVESVSKLLLEDPVTITAPCKGAYQLKDTKESAKKIQNMLREIIFCAGDLGAYATNYVLLTRLVTIERLRLASSDYTARSVYTAIISKIHLLRKLIDRKMANADTVTNIINLSTPKMRALFDLMKDFKCNEMAIVFVKRRITAQALYHVFTDLFEEVPGFQNIKPDFIVGNNSNPFNDIREVLLESRRQNETLKRFALKTTNVLFASDVVEEGVDIPECNMVIKFDHPETLCSYIQSKGRARHKNSRYIIMAPVTPTAKPFTNKYSDFKYSEQILIDELSHKKGDRIGGTETEAQKRLYTKAIEPFYLNGNSGAVITSESAISLLNRYVQMLPHDSFTKPSVKYWKQVHDDKKVSVIIQLPINSVLREYIMGDPYDAVDTAKASAALEACKKLYQLGEINSNLNPVGHLIEINDETICPLWQNETGSDKRKAGTKKSLRIYDKKYPKMICHCTPVANMPTYLHLIKCIPNYDCPSTDRHTVFFNLLKSGNNFAVLTSKPWPKICKFPMYMNVGEVDIELWENYKEFKFTPQELKEIFDFHCLLVTEVCVMRKKFLTKDYENAENTYYFVPVKETYGSVKIDWDTIRSHKFIPDSKPIPPESRSHVNVTSERYLGKIVIPWYRPKGYMLRYIVTKVCEDESPLSPFPCDNYTSYAHYFSNRYNQNIINESQPLLEVRAISSKNTCILPRGSRKPGKKRRRDEDDLEETLVAELCTLIEFPSVYMLKSTLLPSVMHRITLLLLAEEMRMNIASKVGLGRQILKKDHCWEPLLIDNVTSINCDDIPSQQRSTIEISNMLAEKMEKLNPRDCPWDKDDEPIDIEKNIKAVNLLSIHHYVKFSKKPLEMPAEEESHVGDSAYNVKVPEIPILKANINSIGPQQADILQAFISISANDIVNYERLETLGDSFLKFITSVILITSFPKLDEGRLTYLKGKIIGNRNLFYCGRNIELGSILKVVAFAAEDWDVPHYNVLPCLKTLLKDAKVPPGLLYKISLTKEERESSLLSEKTRQQILDVCCNSMEKEDASRTTINIVGQQVVSDKMIADSVEALIGVYLKVCGIEGAMKFCKFLKIFSPEISDVEQVLKAPLSSPLLIHDTNINDLLIFPNRIEDILQYKFKDRGYLLQALTHSSFGHNATDCYQRLEFLGDAILDFLITSHIYDKCGGNLSPGDLTDLRSALVNNVTFACLVVRYGLHKYVLSKTCKLTEIVNNFVKHQQKRNHKIGAEVLFLIDEKEVQVGQAVDVPKMLGDIFESLAGAIYLDSGKSLDTVWKVFYQLMHNEINEFMKDVPKNNIRLLYEKFPAPLPNFRNAEELDNGKGVLIQVNVTHNGEPRSFYGVGENKAQAKLAAAKVALRYFHNQHNK